MVVLYTQTLGDAYSEYICEVVYVQGFATSNAWSSTIYGNASHAHLSNAPEFGTIL